MVGRIPNKDTEGTVYQKDIDSGSNMVDPEPSASRGSTSLAQRVLD